MDTRLPNRIVFLVLPLAVSCSSGDQDVVAGSSSAQSTDSGSELGTLGDPSVRAKLRDMALKASLRCGVSSPGRIVAVASPDHQAAEQVVGAALVPDHVPVYVIVVTGGRFTALRAPPGGTPPQGDVLTLTVDAATWDVLDSGILYVEPDLNMISSTIVDLGTSSL